MTTQDTDRELPFLSHLLELRDRILRMLLAVAVVFVVLMPFANTGLSFLMTIRPMHRNAVCPKATRPCSD